MNIVLQGIDAYVEAFERERASGPVADLAVHAPPSEHPRYLDVLRELIRVDLEFGWAERQPIPLADYRRRFPALFAADGHAQQIAFEEIRLRREAGDQPDLADYRAFGMTERDWAMTESGIASDAPRSNLGLSTGSNHSLVDSPRTDSLLAVDSAADLQVQLHNRLRYISLGCVLILAYFAVLVLLNPLEKVGLSLGSGLVIAFNWAALGACSALAVVLWRRPTLGLRWLRIIETAVFGILLAKLSLDLFSDLFLDHELREPFTQGDHALFHYGSSWSLPFFVLIIAYGALIPSTWRRCIKVVSLMALAPLAIIFVAGLWEGMLGKSFVESFLLQCAIWMIAAAAIAVFGSSRLEVLRHEVMKARRLGQYHLREPLGSGGMGNVFRAEHVLLRRPCAIKLIRPELAGDKTALRRFEHEVQVTATLTHPNTVQVFDYGHAADGTFYYVMEYLPGMNLDQIIRQDGPMPSRRILHILRQICGALREAHAAGLIHRDIKPSNIILGERGGVADVAKLLDFGLALGLQPDRRRSSSAGALAGSPLYMSPEQAAGQEDVDARADIYSLGAVAYFLLTGQPPFVRTSLIDVLSAHIHEPVVPPDRHEPTVPADLQAVVLRCLEKDANRRFPNIESMDAALRQCRDAAES